MLSSHMLHVCPVVRGSKKKARIGTAKFVIRVFTVRNLNLLENSAVPTNLLSCSTSSNYLSERAKPHPRVKRSTARLLQTAETVFYNNCINFNARISGL